MPTLQQATEERLSLIRDLAESGASEMTGKVIRAHTSRGPSQHESGEIVGRFGGLNIKELIRAGVTPKRAAEAIRRGRGKVYDRIVDSVQDELAKEGFIPSRPRSPGRPTVPAHEGKVYCSRCKIPHTKGQHRFHGPGSFHRTHLFSFGGNPTMNVKAAKETFARLMKLSRGRALTESERVLLRRASTVIRSDKKSGYRNPPKVVTFKNLGPGAVFEFADDGMPRGPWRKVGQTRFALADGRGATYEVKPAAKVKVMQGGLFAGGPLFSNRRRRKVARKNRRPVVRAFQNIPGLVRMGKLVELRYERDHGAQPGFYKHEFKVRPVILWDKATNTIIIRGR